MGIYKTYKEAVLANGGTKGVHTSMSGGFITQDALTERLLSGVNEGWSPCNPADYLETLESFLASGKRLVESLSMLKWKPKSGQDVYIAQINTLAGVKEKRYYVHEYWCDSVHQNEYLNCGILFPTKEEAEIKTKTMLGIPIETPAEREERERLESARELYLLSNKVMAGTHMINHYSFQESKDVWLAIVDETSYRKERKQ